MPGNMMKYEYKGISYETNIIYKETQYDQSKIKKNYEQYRLLNATITNASDKKEKKQFDLDCKVTAIDSDGKYLTLYQDDKDINNLLNDGFIINQVLLKGQGLKVGDNINVTICGKKIQGEIKGVCQFLSGENIYTSREFLNRKGVIEKDTFDGVFLNDSNYNKDDSNIASIIQTKDLKTSFNQNMDMFKGLSLIMLIIGVALGILIIGVTTNILLEDNKKNITIMKAMGYSKNEISKACINVYTPLIIVGFIISVPYCYFIMSMIFNAIATAADMVYPINIDIIIIIIPFFLTMIVYYLTIIFYSRKLDKISLGEIMQ
jgi:putative ABC transport system permease protein